MTRFKQTHGCANPLPVNRRNFLGLSAKACLAAGLMGAAGQLAYGQTDKAGQRGGYFAVPPAVGEKQLNRTQFAECLSDYFETTSDGGEKVLLMLLEINELTNPGQSVTNGHMSQPEIDRQREVSFSLIFRGSKAQQLRQRTYRMKHPRLGMLEIFIVPVFSLTENEKPWHDYVAVFNRTQR